MSPEGGEAVGTDRRALVRADRPPAHRTRQLGPFAIFAPI
jgi:hypothetical protein